MLHPVFIGDPYLGGAARRGCATMPVMGYRLIDRDPDPGTVRRLAFVLFLPSGDCAALPGRHGGLALPSGEVREGEHWLLETTLRVPLETAGFLRQRVHPFAAEGDQLYVWLDGDRYAGGRRPHAKVALITEAPDEIAARFEATGQPAEARAVRDAARSIGTQSDED